MTQSPKDEEIEKEDHSNLLPPHLESHEETKIPPIAQKTPKFGPASFQSGSKFGKGAMSANPPLKQRPGRAAGRGR